MQDAGPGPLPVVPDPMIRVRPTVTPVPQKQNRTSLLSAVVKTAADRPKVTLPAAWFIILVAIAVTGLAAAIYLLIRRRAGTPQVPEKPGENPADNATILDAQDEDMVKPNSPGYPAPGIQFPPSLEKRFRDPVFIGEGGLGRVFRARNVKTDETVAVKIPVRFDEVTGTHFTRDIVFWQGLEHENIVRIRSSNILPIPYIEMEYAPSSLASLRLPLPEDKAVGLILGIARGLGYAHEKGIVHRDIKPENILLAADGTPKITDWGLGKAVGDIRQSSMIGFSPSYAAPEQIAPQRYGRPGPATDIYQLGMLLCELLTGIVAFKAEGLHDLNMAILEETPKIPSWQGVHEGEIRPIILKCLSKQPRERYDSVAALIRDLESVQNPT
jgi:eukaryotic-like serine/threonine-protein kinase